MPREQRKAALKIVADVGQCRRGYLTVTRFRVKAPTVPVVGDLEAATFQVRHAVVDIAPVEVRPPGQLVPQEAVVAGPRSQHVDPTPARRRLRRILGDVMIEERQATLDRMGHLHAVRRGPQG